MNDPVFWDRLLGNVVRASGYRQTGTIAGGAVRDYILGLEVKDIDIFVKVPQGLDVIDFNQNLEARGWLYEGEADPLHIYEGTFRVYNFTVEETAIQLIYLENDFAEHFRTFDHSLIRCYYDANDGLRLTPGFVRSMHNRVINMWRGHDRDRTIERMDNLVDKLNAVDPGWTHDQQLRHRVAPDRHAWVDEAWPAAVQDGAIPNPVLPPA